MCLHLVLIIYLTKTKQYGIIIYVIFRKRSKQDNMERDSSKEFYFQWHFLNSCNLRCTHCYQENYKYMDMDLENLLRIADELISALTKWGMSGRISLTGGEPFLSKHLYNLLDYLNRSEKIVSIDILTNGTLITDEDVTKLKQYDKLHQIQISLDGGTEKIHDSIRGNGNFRKAINGIRNLKAGGLEVALMYTLQKLNIDGYDDFIDLAISENVDAVTVERVTPCGQSALEEIIPADEIKRIYTDITKRANKMLAKPVIRRGRPLWINTVCDSTRTDCTIGGFCPVGFTALAILHDGTVLPCRRMEIPLGNILTDGLYKIWYTSDVLWKIRDKNNLKGKCHGCENLPFCGGCRAVAYAATGDYMEEDPQCWK